MFFGRRKPAGVADSSLADEASETFVRRLYGTWSDSDQVAFELRMERDLAFADAWRAVEESWRALDARAEAPEVMAYREEALATMRRAYKRRWLPPVNARLRIAAAAACVMLVVAVVWQVSPLGFRPGDYSTGIGEQRIIELADHSRIALDAATRLKVSFSDDARSIELLEGQAQFSVAKDPARPFKVRAGDRTIVALGTVFTVEYTDRKVHVAMLEGKVAVLAAAAASRTSAGSVSASPPEAIHLAAGEELRVLSDGQTLVSPQADLEAATAWREGKVILRTETVGAAVNRMNRYSRLQIQIDDPALAAREISGVFEAGDSRGFIDALQRYLPLTADYSQADVVRLEMQ